jgi:hypothetical protein
MEPRRQATDVGGGAAVRRRQWRGFAAGVRALSPRVPAGPRPRHLAVSPPGGERWGKKLAGASRRGEAEGGQGPKGRRPGGTSSEPSLEQRDMTPTRSSRRETERVWGVRWSVSRLLTLARSTGAVLQARVPAVPASLFDPPTMRSWVFGDRNYAKRARSPRGRSGGFAPDIHRPSRKANTSDLGVQGEIRPGVVRRARCQKALRTRRFMSRFTFAYRQVVAMLSWPR